MRQAITRTVTSVLCAAALLLAANVSFADEWPLAAGDFWEVTGIDTKDGGELKYAQWLATEWRKNTEFAISKGYIKDVKILYNQYPRKGEPDLYLVWIRESIPTGPESEKRAKEFQDWKKKTIETMVGESGNRAEYREVVSSSLLQEAPFRK